MYTSDIRERIMDERQQEEVAKALEAPPELMPFLPELLADLWVLGSSLDTMVSLVRPLELPAGETRVLDLGCGKGAVSITLAQEFGFQVRGVDLFEPFVKEARERAEGSGVSGLCEFMHADMRDVIEEASCFDIAIYAAVGGVLGTWDECVAHMRQCVCPSGYMLIDDGFLNADERVERPGYEHYATHQETLRQLTAHGDTLLREVIIPAEEIHAIDQKFIGSIGKRAAELAELYPEATDTLLGYVKNQELESQTIETMLTGAVWLLKRA